MTPPRRKPAATKAKPATPSPKAPAIEFCPKCHDGHLVVAASSDEYELVRCLNCDYSASAFKPGHEPQEEEE